MQTKSNQPVPVPRQNSEYATRKLKVALLRRNAAWARVNPKAQPSRDNDWASFAVESGEYHKFYRQVHDGQGPEDDQVEVEATAYWYKFIAKQPMPDAKPKTDEQRDKGNERKQVKPDYLTAKKAS